VISNGIDTIQKYMDLVKYLYIILQNCPRSEKYTYCADTRSHIWKIGGLLKRASVVFGKSEKLRLLQSADDELSELRFIIEAGMELEFVHLKQYNQFCIQVTEVGRMLGGWLKYARQA
jgi:four helix bundle protein